MKKTITIENLIRWTYRDELPKEQATTSFLRPDTFANPSAGVIKMGMLGTPVDEPDIANKYGLFPDFQAHEPPHPDAVRVYHAVRALDYTFDPPDDWNPLVGLGDLGADHAGVIAAALRGLSVEAVDGKRYLRDVHAPMYLIQKAAIRDIPDWRSEPAVRKTMKMQDGRTRWFILQDVITEQGKFTIEVDGFDYSKNAPKTGAYKKTFFDPDPVVAAVARGEYEIWHAALGILADELAGRLDDHEVTPSDRPARPWEDGDRPVPRILIDTTPRQPLVREPRPVAGPPPYRGIARTKDEAAA